MATPTPNPDRVGRAAVVLAGLGAVVLVLAIIRLCVGTGSLGWPTGEMASIVLETRKHRLYCAATVGVAIAISGVALQTLLRNPLAEPYILGLSTGAAAGVLAQSLVFYTLGIALGPGFVGALAGAAASMLVVYLAGRRHGVIDPLGLLLTGVVLATINGGLLMLFNYAAGPGGLRDDLARWMMGYINEREAAGVVFRLSLGMGIVEVTVVQAIAAVTLAGLVVLLAQASAMDVATLSAGEATSLGVNVPRMRTMLFVVASVLAAGAVVLAGPVAFAGLICPHLARLMLGPRHATLIVGSALCGAALILLADTTSSVIAYNFDTGLIPIGVFTAILGGPAFLWMLRPQLGRGME